MNLSHLDHAIAAEKAATMLRKGSTPREVCAKLGLGRGQLNYMAQAYDFRIPEERPFNWPSADEPGDAGGFTANHRRDAAWLRSKRGARTLLARLPDAPKWPDQPEPAFYDECAPTPDTGPMTGPRVLREICGKHHISKAALLGPLRYKPICAARHEAAFRLIVELGYSYPRAGRMLGDRDHTTILNSVRRHVERNPGAALAYQAFCGRVEADNQVLRETVIREHFVKGLSVAKICQRHAISRIKLMGMLIEALDERDAERQARAA